MTRWTLWILMTAAACAAAFWLGRREDAPATAPVATAPATPPKKPLDDATHGAAPAAAGPSVLRSATAAPMPPMPGADVPLSQAYADLAARARAGDAAAAQRLSGGLLHCRREQRWRRLVGTAAARAVIEQQVPEHATNDELIKADRKLDIAERVMKLAQTQDKACSGLSARQIEEAFQWQQRAAELDADDAKLCLLDRADIDPVHYASEVEHLRAYRDVAARYVDERLRAGDWGVVVALAQASSVRFSPTTQLSLLYEPDDATEFRYLSLLRLNSAIDDPEFDAEYARVAAALDPSARNAAEAWARDMRANYFHSAPTASRPIDAPVCSDSGG